MTEAQKKAFWASLSDQGKIEFKSNLDNCIELIKRFKLVPDDSAPDQDNQSKKSYKGSQSRRNRH